MGIRRGSRRDMRRQRRMPFFKWECRAFGSSAGNEVRKKGKVGGKTGKETRRK